MKSQKQQSEKMLLQAQQPYYIEVLHRNIGGPSFLSVAWEGPGLAQAVIGGQYLAPWLTGVARAAPGTAQRGTILHECWLALGTTFRDLGTGPSVLSSPELTSLKVTDLGEQGVATRHIQPGEPFPAEPDYCWAEVEGQVTAVSELEDAPLLELTQGDRRMTLKLEERPEGGTLSALLGAKVHAEGACVSALDPHGHRVAELLRVPDLRHIELREVPHVPLTPLHELEKGASFEGQRVRVCGRVVEMSEDGFRVEEGGSRFFAYVSTNGTDWDPVGDMSVPLEQTGVVGLAVLSHTNGTLTEAAFSKAEWLGENWQHTDIDTNTAPQGQVRLGSDGGVVKGGGSDINHDTQQFHYVWRTNTGDATLVVRVDSLLNTHEWAKAGIMFRDRPEVNSRYAALFITPDHGAQFQWRGTDSGDTSFLLREAQAPCWLKLVRRSPALSVALSGGSEHVHPGHWVEVLGVVGGAGDKTRLTNGFCRFAEENWSQAPIVTPEQIAQATGANWEQHWVRVSGQVLEATNGLVVLDDGQVEVRGDASSDGRNWKPVGSAVVQLGGPAYVGLTACAEDARQEARAVFSELKGLPRNLQSVDIGNPNRPGTNYWEEDKLRMTAGGVQMFNDSQQFHFAAARMPSTGSVVVKVDSLEGASEWTKVGLQFRERLAEASRYVNLALSRQHGVELQFRTARTGNTTSTLVDASAPYWLKLTWRPVQLPVHTGLAKNNVEPGQRIEVLGSLHWDETNASLNDAVWRPVQTGVANGQDERIGPADASVVTALGELWQMPLEEAARAHPVRLRGVLTYAEPGLVALDDGTTGLWLVGGQALEHAQAGDFVQVEGTSRAGAVSPEVEVNNLQVLSAGALPHSPATSLAVLLANSHDSQWVEMRGVAHEVRPKSLVLAVEGGTLEAFLPNELEGAKRAELSGSLLRVRRGRAPEPGQEQNAIDPGGTLRALHRADHHRTATAGPTV